MALIETERDSGGGRETALRDWVRALEATAPIAREPERTLANVIAEIARERPDAPALISTAESLSYGALAARINRFARWALEQGLAKGDVVGLMMPNRPEYMAIWLGITSVGVVVALINTNLRGAFARPLHRHRRAAAHHRRRRACRALRPPRKHSTSRPKIWAHGERGP